MTFGWNRLDPEASDAEHELTRLIRKKGRLAGSWADTPEWYGERLVALRAEVEALKRERARLRKQRIGQQVVVIVEPSPVSRLRRKVREVRER